VSHTLITRAAYGTRNLAVSVLVAWFLFILAGSLLGLFDSEPRPPIPLGLAAVIPVAAFALCYLASARFREFALSLNLQVLTLVQTWRVLGLVFVIEYWRGSLPGMFALPAGWGDFAIGITAPLVALWRGPFPRTTLIVWNVLGILDLVLAVSLGVLSSATPAGILAGDVSTRIMGQFPLSLIPAFFVPLLLIVHLISLAQIGRRNT
jgi:hypothetical protein